MAKDKSEKKKTREVHDTVEQHVVEDTGAMDTEDDNKVKTAKKHKKVKEENAINIEDLSPITRPLAEEKLVKRLHKTIKKASKARQLKRGVKEVVKSIRKGERGLLILAADINPIDIISHLPVLAEEAQIPYVFVMSKEELGHASSTKRPTSCVMICPDQKKSGKRKDGDKKDADDDGDYRELFDKCCREVQKLDSNIVF